MAQLKWKIIKKMTPRLIKKTYSRFVQLNDKRYVLKRFDSVTTELKEVTMKKRIILIGTSVYGNLGDQAISEAEVTFLKDHNKEDNKIIEIPNNYYVYKNDLVKKSITENDVLVINGGGFLGTLWPAGENMARDIIKSFPNNKIIIFPQTIFFSKNEYGKRELEISRKIYQSHSNLFLFVRDQQSYNFAIKNLKGNKLQNIFLVPDIVTYLNKSKNTNKRNTILFCMRSDKEKVDNNSQLSAVKTFLQVNNKDNIVNQDTVVNERIDFLNRKEKLNDMLKYFYNAELVITDRLHGMLLSAITGTPCLALNNVSGKVRGAFEWIEHLGYIKFAENSNEIEVYLTELLSAKYSEYDNSTFNKYYKTLSETIFS